MIRKATKQDIPALVAAGIEMHNESRFSIYQYDEYKVSSLFETLIESDTGIVLVAEEQGEIVGGFVGTVCQHFFGYTTMSFDFALYVLPEFRGSSVGYRLIKAYIAEAKALQVDEIQIATSTGVATEMVEQMYERLGFFKSGTAFSLRN